MLTIIITTEAAITVLAVFFFLLHFGLVACCATAKLGTFSQAIPQYPNSLPWENILFFF